jgi:hypothetical protein
MSATTKVPSHDEMAPWLKLTPDAYTARLHGMLTQHAYTACLHGMLTRHAHTACLQCMRVGSCCNVWLQVNIVVYRYKLTL